MVLFALGESACGICGEVVEKTDPYVPFSAFIGNKLDPLYKFSDNIFHARCFEHDPFADEARSVQQQAIDSASKAGRVCRQCDLPLTNHINYWSVGYLCSHRVDATAATFNFAQLHWTHIRDWDERSDLLDALRRLVANGVWEASGLARQIDLLDSMERGSQAAGMTIGNFYDGIKLLCTALDAKGYAAQAAGLKNSMNGATSGEVLTNIAGALSEVMQHGEVEDDEIIDDLKTYSAIVHEFLRPNDA